MTYRSRRAVSVGKAVHRRVHARPVSDKCPKAKVAIDRTTTTSPMWHDRRRKRNTFDVNGWRRFMISGQSCRRQINAFSRFAAPPLRQT